MKITRWGRKLAIIFGIFTVASCATSNPDRHAQRIATAAHLTRELVPTATFLIVAFVRLGDRRQPIRVYIEGDGYAFKSRWEPSADPTPHRAIGLQMASRDDGANVVYLARPCQFTHVDPHCGVAIWTTERFSPSVIEAENQALDILTQRNSEQRIELVGYSGGGAVAVLLSEKRRDVASIRTVAGNLDNGELLRLHHVSPMPKSLDPFSLASKLALIPQIHFSGSDDSIVPPQIALEFARAAGGTCVRTVVVPGMTHEGAWGDAWARLLAERPQCR